MFSYSLLSGSKAWRTLLPLAGTGLALLTLLATTPVKSSHTPVTEVLRLKNGLTVLVSPEPTVPSFSATILYRTGTAREWPGVYGVTELAAAMLLDGTSELGSRNPKEESRLLKELDALDMPIRSKRLALEQAPQSDKAALAAELRALEARFEDRLEKLRSLSSPEIMARLYMDRGATRPVVTVSPTEVRLELTLPSSQLSYFFAMEAARLSDFSSRAFFADRQRLAEAAGTPTPSLSLRKGLLSQAFQVHPFGRIHADKSSILGIDRAELLFYHQRFFGPRRTVVALSGSVRPKEVRKLAQHYLEPFKDNAAPLQPLEPKEARQSGERRLEVRGGASTEVMLGFHRNAVDLPTGSPIIPLLRTFFQDPFNGPLLPLYQSGLLASHRMLEAPDQPPFGPPYPSLLVLHSVAAPGVSPQTLEAALFQALSTFTSQGLSATQLEAAKKQVKLELAMQTASPSSRSTLLARTFALFGEVKALERFEVSLEDASQEEVLQAARAIFVRSNATVATLLPEPLTKESPTTEPQASPVAAPAPTPSRRGAP